MRLVLVAVILTCLLLSPLSALAFTDSGQINPEFQRTDPAIIQWASRVLDHQLGPMDYADPGLGLVGFGLPTDVLGPAGSPFSLGDGGFITLGFDEPIADGPGADFVVFENAFEFGGVVFMEIGFVEVSSDGVNFARMPSICRVDSQMGTWGGENPASFYNLAGNFTGGTGFDLQDLVDANDPEVGSGVVDLFDINFVRVVDVIGHITNPSAPMDYFGTPVSDPYPTAFASGGMDLTGVGVIHTYQSIPTERSSFGKIKSLYR